MTDSQAIAYTTGHTLFSYDTVTFVTLHTDSFPRVADVHPLRRINVSERYPCLVVSIRGSFIDMFFLWNADVKSCITIFKL
jgi:hypothetical protein